MRARVQKWGNSLALRIPKPFAEEVGMAEGGEVRLSGAEAGKTLPPTTGAARRRR